MRQLLLIPILSLILWTFAGGQSSYEQNLLSTVNPKWKEVVLTEEQKIQVRKCQTYTDLIQVHLAFVADRLIQSTKSMQLSSAATINRLHLIDVLTGYYREGTFPMNNKASYTTPIFVDDKGTHCAVGYLMHKSGHDEVVSRIADENNLAYVEELNDKYDVLGTWAFENGFTVDELAWIQPGYACHPDIQFGEVIQPSCYGSYDGAFWLDAPALLPGFDLYSWGEVYVWQDTTWEYVGIPDCLRAGHYKQHIGVSLFDSSFVVELLFDLGQPDSITFTHEITGKPRWCEGYINPTITGGIAPYAIQVYDQEGNPVSLGPLCEGNYYVTVQDANDCSRGWTVSVVEPAIECDAFCITDIRLDDPVKDYLNITIFFEGENDDFINYPHVQAVINPEGDTIATGTLNFFGHIGNTSQVYSIETTMDSLPANFEASIVFNYDTNTCILPYPCLTSGIPPLEKINLAISPNPFRDATYVELEEGLQHGMLSLFNMQGQKVRQASLNGDVRLRIERENLPPGQYILQVNNQQKMAIGKLCILD